MKRLGCLILALFALWLVSAPPAAAQTVNLWCYTGPTNPQWQPCSAANPLSVTGSFTATTTGFPGSTQTTGTPISVTTGGVTGTLPTGAVVVATNVGTTNTAYCKLGASATTSDQAISPNGGWFAFTVGTNTQLTCITSTSTTTVNMVGGAGLPTGTGGGSGTTITGFSTAANQATNTATTAHTCSVAGFSELGCLGQIDDDVKGPIAAGTNVIGFVSNDPCAQGTKLGAPINLTASGQIITGTSAKKTYICAIDVVTATAQNIALVEGTGSTCATNIFGLAGGTTAATGWNITGNGIARGSGSGTVYSPSADTNATAANVCLLLSSTGQTSGQISYVQQ